MRRPIRATALGTQWEARCDRGGAPQGWSRRTGPRPRRFRHLSFVIGPLSVSFSNTGGTPVIRQRPVSLLYQSDFRYASYAAADERQRRASMWRHGPVLRA